MSLQKAGTMLNPLPDGASFWRELALLCVDEPQPWDFALWESVLELARMRGIAAVDERGEFAGPFGPALLRRWRWLQEAYALDLTPEQAERDFAAVVQRERERERQRFEEFAHNRSRSLDRRTTTRRRSEASDL